MFSNFRATKTFSVEGSVSNLLSKRNSILEASFGPVIICLMLETRPTSRVGWTSTNPPPKNRILSQCHLIQNRRSVCLHISFRSCSMIGFSSYSLYTCTYCIYRIQGCPIVGVKGLLVRPAPTRIHREAMQYSESY